MGHRRVHPDPRFRESLIDCTTMYRVRRPPMRDGRVSGIRICAPGDNRAAERARPHVPSIVDAPAEGAFRQSDGGFPLPRAQLRRSGMSLDVHLVDEPMRGERRCRR